MYAEHRKLNPEDETSSGGTGSVPTSGKRIMKKNLNKNMKIRDSKSLTQLVGDEKISTELAQNPYKGDVASNKHVKYNMLAS